MMKRLICIVILLSFVLLVAGCAEQPKDAIVGQWVYEDGSYYLLIYPNGDIFSVSTNAAGEYITGVMIHEDGSYETLEKWYKNSNNEYIRVTSGGESLIILEEDSLSFDDGVHMWYKLSKSKELPLKNIYYSTFDKENMAYVYHPLSELIK